MKWYIYLILLFSLNSFTKAQVEINENQLMETYWQYTNTLHAESGTAIHTADESYEYFLHFKFDFTYEHYLNGKTQKGPWLFNDKTNEIYYDFRNNKWWEIVEFTPTTLTLSFTSNQGDFYYKFKAAEPEVTPFKRSRNVLPTVKVKDKRAAKRLARLATKKERRTAKLQEKMNKRRAKKEKPTVPVEIRMMGGGFYGGIDPVMKDYVMVKSDGRLIKEYQSKQKGLIKTVKDVPLEDLERFAQFAEGKNFFKLDKMYDCTSSMCKKRKSEDPIPIPLTISIQYGDKYNRVTVMIWGQDDRRGNYIKYPKEIDDIVDGIRKLAGV